MKEYVRPEAVATDLAEGVFMASGAAPVGENHVEIIISNSSMDAAWFLGAGHWQAGVKWTYEGGHNCKGFRVTAVYDKPVTFYNYYPTMQSLVSGDGTNTLVIDFMQDESTSGHMMNITVSCDTQATLQQISAQCYH